MWKYALFILLLANVGCEMSLDNSNNKNQGNSKTLYLIRHAKSSHKDATLADIERPLNSRGKSDAVLMGTKLLEKNPSGIDAIVISPSKRTKSTAKRIAKLFDFDKDAIQKDSALYRCPTRVLIAAVQDLDDKHDKVIMIGHNPSIIQTANYFQKDTIFMDVPTCGIIAIKFNGGSWKDFTHKSGTFQFFDYPKKHRVKKD